MDRVGSIKPVMDALVELAERVGDTEDVTASERMAVYRWKPAPGPSSFPALWHFVSPDAPPPEQKDTNRLRDVITISAYIGVRHSDQELDIARLEVLSDAYRDTFDPAIWQPQPLNGSVTWAKRLGMRPVSVSFGGAEVMAFEFPLEFWLDRQLTQTN